MSRGTHGSAASWVCRRWVSLYTRGVPATERQRRRDEIESDLFEHAHEARHAGVGAARFSAEILARVLVGVPADLSWRRATRQPHPRLALGDNPMSLTTSTSRRLLYGLCGLIVLYGLFLSGVGVFSDWNDSLTSTIAYVAVPALSAMILIVGLAVHPKNPRRGLPLIIAGVIGPAVWFWMLPFYGPAMIAAIALAVSVTPRKQARLAVT